MITGKFNLSLALFVGTFSIGANSYELTTHSELTKRAYAVSTLGSQLKQLGLVDLPEPFDRKYYDFTGFDVWKRSANSFEASKMRDPDTDQYKIVGWLMRGAVREDDGGLAAGLKAGEPVFKDPDPSGLINRFCNHFLDPGSRGPLPLGTLCESPADFGSPNGQNFSAVNWAIGTNPGSGDAFSANPQRVENFRNHFTIFNAREAMWRALTLRGRDGSTTVRVFGDTDEQVRKAYWAATFRALGDVLHLNQDMAQPQHTRAEGHGIGHAAVYEKYVDARAKGDREFVFDPEGNITAQSGQLPPLPLDNLYPIPRFSRYSDYWSTDQGAASISAGKGLADYSSRGFFTPAKNLGSSYAGFPSPAKDEFVYTVTTDTPQFPGDCTGYAGRVKYAKGNLPADFINGASGTTRYANRSMVATLWTLNRCVFDDRVTLLIPRAVAYSAGLIDYFFRGQMEVTPPEEGVYSLVDHYDFSGEGKTPTDVAAGFKGFKTIKLKLRNATPDITPSGGGTVAPQIMPGGTLVAVLKFYRNVGHTDDLANEPANSSAYTTNRSTAEEIVVSSSVKDASGNPLTAPIPISNSLQTFIFEFSQELPINATDVKLQVVYRGTLGSEADAVVVQTVDISEPSYFTFMNASDYIRIATSDIGIPNSVYTRAEINANTTFGSTLRSRIRPTSCIDTMTNQLNDTPGCHQPIPINFPIKWGTSTANAATINLPNAKTYHRFAMLTPPNSIVSINQSASTCVPNDPVLTSGKVIQTNYLPDSSPAGYEVRISVDSSPPVRGVRGWANIACVNNGDNSTPGVGDNRYTKMDPLPSINLKPLKTQSFAFP